MKPIEIANASDRQLRDWALALAEQNKRESDIAFWNGAMKGLEFVRALIRHEFKQVEP